MFEWSVLESDIEERTYHARTLLAETDTKVLSIVFDSYFGSRSTFQDAFLGGSV